MDENTLLKHTSHVTGFNSVRGTRTSLKLLPVNERQASGEQRHSNIVYREIFNNVAVPIWICDPDTLQILDVNGDVSETFGYSVEEALALKIGNISSDVSPHTREALNELLLKAAAGEPQFSEWLCRRKDGSLLWIGLNIRSAMISIGRCVIILMRNITRRKRIEENLRTSEERYRRLFDMELDAILLLETSTQRILDSNVAASLLYGYTKEELLGMTTPDISAEPEKTREATIDGTTRVPLRYHKKKDGTVFPVEIVATHIKLGDGTGDLCIAAVRDITERKHAEDALVKSRLYLARIIEFLPDATFAVDTRGNIVVWNRAMEKMTGIMAGDIVERGNYRHVLRRYTDDCPVLLGFFIEKSPEELEILNEHYRDAVRDGDVIYAIMHRNIPGLGKRVLWAKASPLRNESGDVIGAIEALRDITKEKENAQTLRLQALVLDQISDHVTITDLEGRVTYVNRAEADSKGSNKRGQLSNLYRNGSCCPGVPGGIIEATLDHGHWRGEITAYTDTDCRYTMDCRSQVIHDETGNPVALCGIATDITQRKHAERAVRESETKFKEIFETMEDLYYQLDQNGTVILVSPSARRLTGWSEEELVGKQASMFYADPKEREVLLSVIMKRGYLHDREVSLVRRDGQVRTASLSARLITDENGRYTGMRGVLRDITERKAVEKALMDSEKKYRSLFENSVTGIFRITPEGKFVTVNLYLARLCGYRSSQEMLETGIEMTGQFYAERKRWEHFRSMMDSEKHIDDFEVMVLRQNGTMAWASMSARVVEGDDASARFYEGILKDITEKKKFQDELGKCSEAMAASDEGMAILDMNHTYTYVNTAYAKIYGYDGPHELTGQTWMNSYPVNEVRRFLQDIMPQVEKDGKWRGEAIGLRRNGTEFPQDISLGLIESGGFICVVRDVTVSRSMLAAIKEHERELEAKSSELEEMNTALTVLLKQREKDRNELEERFVSNVREKILPYIARVKRGQLSPEQKVFLESAEVSLNEITSPFLHTMKQCNFTPKEIEVASLIKEGKATKDIAELMCASPRAVESHRDNIRKKLGLSRKMNLRSYLINVA